MRFRICYRYSEGTSFRVSSLRLADTPFLRLGATSNLPIISSLSPAKTFRFYPFSEEWLIALTFVLGTA